MELLFSIQNQHIERVDSMYPVADSIDYLTARFSFSTNDWEGLTKTAIFKNGEVAKRQILDANNECVIPWEVVKRGKLSVSLFAGNRITTDACIVDIVASGYTPTEPPEEPTPTEYEQMVEILDNLKGGNAGKVLAKATGADYDFAWVTGGGGGGGTAYWGEILGEITEQADLQDALDAKANASNTYTKAETDAKIAEELTDYNPTTNFKTVGGVSIIGTGNIPVSGGGGTDVVINPPMSGTEETATSIKVNNDIYVFPNTNTYGFTPAQITMLETILRNATYSSDVSATIDAFIESLSAEPTPKVLSSITAVLNNPTVEQGTTYVPNATVTAHYDDSTSAVVTSGVIYSTIDTSTTGTKTLTISYTENEVTKTTTATVTVTAEPVVKELTSITSVLTGTYTTDNVISDVTSHITTTAHYSDSTTATVVGTYDTSGVTMSVAGTYTIPVSYTEDGVTKTTTVSLTVAEASGGDITLTWTQGQKISSNGKPTSSANDAISQFVNVENGTFAVGQTTDNNITLKVFMFSDDNGTLVSSFSESAITYTRAALNQGQTLTFREGTKFVRLDVYTQDFATLDAVYLNKS